MLMQDRLELLVKSGQVSRTVVEVVREIARKVKESFGLDLSEEDGSMFVTHLAVALERLRRGEPIKEAPESLLEEIREFHDESTFVSELEVYLNSRLGVSLPLAEKAFCVAHLRALRSRT